MVLDDNVEIVHAVNCGDNKLRDGEVGDLKRAIKIFTEAMALNKMRRDDALNAFFSLMVFMFKSDGKTHKDFEGILKAGIQAAKEHWDSI